MYGLVFSLFAFLIIISIIGIIRIGEKKSYYQLEIVQEEHVIIAIAGTGTIPLTLHLLRPLIISPSCA